MLVVTPGTVCTNLAMRSTRLLHSLFSAPEVGMRPIFDRCEYADNFFLADFHGPAH